MPGDGGSMWCAAGGVGGHGTRKTNIIRRGMSKGKTKEKKKNLQVGRGQARNGRGVDAVGGVTTKGGEQHRDETLGNESEQKGNKKKKKTHIRRARTEGHRGRTTGMVIEKECQQGKQCE